MCVKLSIVLFRIVIHSIFIHQHVIEFFQYRKLHKLSVAAGIADKDTPCEQAAKAFIIAFKSAFSQIFADRIIDFCLVGGNITIDPLVDAIAAGNTAVVKPSAYSPYTSQIIKTIIGECFDAESTGPKISSCITASSKEI